MPRLFTGLEISSAQSKALSQLQTGLRGARWVEPSDFHLTLRFIGDVDRHTANEIFDALSARSWPTPQIQLTSLNVFGNKRPSSLHTEVAPNQILNTLRASHERIMQELNLTPDGRKFTPHVTIARFRNLADESLSRYLTKNCLPDLQPFTPKRFVLYSAKESTGGGPYRVEATWPLDGSNLELSDD